MISNKLWNRYRTAFSPRPNLQVIFPGKLKGCLRIPLTRKLRRGFALRRNSARARGVDVRVLYDAAGVTPATVRTLAAAGVLEVGAVLLVARYVTPGTRQLWFWVFISGLVATNAALCRPSPRSSDATKLAPPSSLPPPPPPPVRARGVSMNHEEPRILWKAASSHQMEEGTGN